MEHQQYFSQVGALSLENVFLTTVRLPLQSEVDLGGAIYHGPHHTYPQYEASALVGLYFLPL